VLSATRIDVDHDVDCDAGVAFAQWLNQVEGAVRRAGLVIVVALTATLNSCGGRIADCGAASGGNSAPSLQLLAGNIGGGPGHADGTGAAASFYGPGGIAVDSAGNVYVADSFNYTIRKITPAGLVSTFAGTPGVLGSANGIGAAASFNQPQGIAVDSAGNVYVADSFNYTVRKITPAGLVSTFAGTPGVLGSADGLGASASFNLPQGIATDKLGNIYVADSDVGTPNGIIRKITAAGVVSTLAGKSGVYGSTDGIGVAASFGTPQGVATDSAGNVYVADKTNSNLRRITPAGMVSTLAGTAGVLGSADGIGVAARFNQPQGIAADSAGNVYVADTGNNTIRKVTPAEVVSTFAGKVEVAGSADGPGAAATFRAPQGVATDSAGNVYVPDTGNSTVRRITPAGVVITFVGRAGSYGIADGVGSAANFGFPNGIATDNIGNSYVTDFIYSPGSNSGTSYIRRITPNGAVTTLAVQTGFCGSASALGTTAIPGELGGIVTDSSGNIYFAEMTNNVICRFTQAGELSTLAGEYGVSGSADGFGAAASFSSPSGLAMDSSGNLFVADTGNNTIRKVSATGLVSTVAGTAGVMGSADGIGVAARFNQPQGIAADSAGNVYVADTGNNTIRKVTPAGEVSTVVGVAGQAAFKAGPLPGLLMPPTSVAIRDRTLYITASDGLAVVHDVP
jgi:sugar lactone lactonase YvrE